ncbi:MAG: helix-turn-helix transcriptional regulator [Bacteroidales bacterium]|jgi:DNA-binding NarL/FixJ family response regulator
MEDKTKFSAREKTILQLVAQAKCRKIIASELNLSIHTVDTHLRHIHLKTNTHSMVELLVWAMNGSNHLLLSNYL